MSKRFPLSITELVDDIKELVGGYLGEFENGSMAIHVRPPELPDWQINGILCMIERYPRLLRSRNCKGSPQAIQMNDWIVLFRQYDRNVVPVTLTANVEIGDITMTIAPLQAPIHQGAHIEFSGVSITTTSRAAAGVTEIAIAPTEGLAIAGAIGLHKPMEDLDGVVAAMRSRFPNMRERILETTEEGVYPQVSYLLNFTNFVNLI